jgi:hypothetical protein
LNGVAERTYAISRGRANKYALVHDAEEAAFEGGLLDRGGHRVTL